MLDRRIPFLTMTKGRDELGEVGDLSKICTGRVWFSDLSAVQALQMDAPQRERMLKRELFPTLGMPTTPTCKLLLGRPSMAFFSATTSASAHCQHGAHCDLTERESTREGGGGAASSRWCSSSFARVETV